LKTLFLEGETYKELSDLGGDGAWGIDIDKQKNELYVTNSTNVVHRYDTNSWEHKGSVPIVVDSTPRQAVGIAIDSNRHYMYTGAFYGTGGYHYNLVRTDINDPNNPTSTEKYIGAFVIGLAIDEDTGYLYATTSSNQILVFNTLTWPSDPCYTETNYVSHPAGLCLGGNITYKPGGFDFAKDVNIPDGNCVLPGQSLTYTISYDANGQSDTNVIIIDYLPDEVNYISSSPDGNYNPGNRTVTWNVGSISPDSNGIFTIIVNANELAEPCGVITNHCEIEGDGFRNISEKDTPVCSWWPEPGIIYVDDTATGRNSGMSWQNAYSDLQDALDRAALGCGSQIWVAGGAYIPSKPTPPPLYFQLVNGVPIYGHFAGNETSIDHRNLSNPANESVIDGTDVSGLYVVRANGLTSNTILDGFSIKSAHSGIYYCELFVLDSVKI